MTGCGENWCFNPWDWMTTFCLLKLAIFGAEGYAGSPASGESWG